MHALTIILTLLPFTIANLLTLNNPRTNTCQTCDPNPNKNLCNPTTSCTLIGNHTYCACRAGYRADTATPPGDTSVQWRLPYPYQEGRVFVAPGVMCNTLCDEWTLGKDGCKEVSLKSDCA